MKHERVHIALRGARRASAGARVLLLHGPQMIEQNLSLARCGEQHQASDLIHRCDGCG